MSNNQYDKRRYPTGSDYDQQNRRRNYDRSDEEYPRDAGREYQNLDSRTNNRQRDQDQSYHNYYVRNDENLQEQIRSNYTPPGDEQEFRRPRNEEEFRRRNSAKSSDTSNYEWQHGEDWEGRYGPWKNYDRSRANENYGLSNNTQYRRADFRAADPRASFPSDESWRRREQTRYSSTTGWSKGGHTGKGPKGYKRSDSRIEEDINEILTMHNELDASDLHVSVSDAIVTLSGEVDSRESKRLAEDIAAVVSGVRDVRNELTIVRISDWSRDDAWVDAATGMPLHDGYTPGDNFYKDNTGREVRPAPEDPQALSSSGLDKEVPRRDREIPQASNTTKKHSSRNGKH